MMIEHETLFGTLVKLVGRIPLAPSPVRCVFVATGT